MRNSFHASALSLGAAMAALFFGCEATPSGPTDHSQSSLVRHTNVGGGGGQTAPAYEATGQPEGIARLGGRYFHIREGKATEITQRQRFSAHSSFERDGRVILGDGGVVRLAEREMVTFTGDRLPAPAIELPQRITGEVGRARR